ncbi:MAG: glycosyltransferase, partial [Myxococcales bacterium]|nr:glycosyltransferase [Myxococcales bacterium]
LPVVASDLGGCRDVVASGVSGALVPVGASAALAEALEVYLRDEGLRRRHGAAGRARALEAFVPEDRWHATAALYARLVEGRR